MIYRFSFRSPGTNYGAGGFETEKEAISGLEQISRSYCKEGNSGKGRIFEVGNDDPIKEYEIRLVDGKLYMKII